MESEKLEENGREVDEWMTGPWVGQYREDHLSKLKLYAQTCKQKLGKYISSAWLYSYIKNEAAEMWHFPVFSIKSSYFVIILIAKYCN